jgi:hypothetical protein
MEDTNLVVAHAFATEAEAEMAKSALQSAGIDAMIQADSAGGLRPHIAWASGGFKVLVREEDAADAHEALAPVGGATPDE